jgi:ribonuclease Z
MLVAFAVHLSKMLEDQGTIIVNGKTISLNDVSWVKKGDIFSIVIDTSPCRAAITAAKDAKLLVCESTYLEAEKALAKKHRHLTAKQAATIAKEAGAQHLILTHFSARYLDLEPFLEEARAIFPNTDVADDLKRFPFLK